MVLERNLKEILKTIYLFMYNKQCTIPIQIGLNLFNFRLSQIEVLPVYIQWYGAFG